MSTEPVITEQTPPVQEELPFVATINIEKDWRYEGQIFNNGNREIDLAVVEAIMADPKKRATHQTVMPWWGHIAYINGKFVEQIKLNGDIIAQYEADTPEELLTLVNSKHGGWK